MYCMLDHCTLQPFCELTHKQFQSRKTTIHTTQSIKASSKLPRHLHVYAPQLQTIQDTCMVHIALLDINERIQTTGSRTDTFAQIFKDHISLLLSIRPAENQMEASVCLQPPGCRQTLVVMFVLVMFVEHGDCSVSHLSCCICCLYCCNLCVSLAVQRALETNEQQFVPLTGN